MNHKNIVVDANILIRAVLGKRVSQLIDENSHTVNFFAPDIAFSDASKYLPTLFKTRDLGEQALVTLDTLSVAIRSVDIDIYKVLKYQALDRISMRDANDWPILACAMRFDCPIWTEDVDFFGTGVATWTTDRIALYFSS